MSFFSHTQITTQAGSVVYVRVECSRNQAYEDISRSIDRFPSRFEMAPVVKGLYNASSITVLKVWMDGHGRRPATYFQYVLASSHFLGHFRGILESVHALLFSHFKHWSIMPYNPSMAIGSWATHKN